MAATGPPRTVDGSGPTLPAAGRQMTPPRYVAAVDRDAAPGVADAIGSAVADIRPYRHLPMVAFDSDEPTARRVAELPGVMAVVPVPPDVMDADNLIKGLDVILGIADAQRLGIPTIDLYGGTVAEDPYPALRPGSPPVFDTDPSVSLVTPPAAMVAVNLSLGPRSPSYGTTAADPVNLATLALSHQQLVVMAAGNEGSGPRETMSAWAEMPWVLAVGATADPEGRELAPYSSRGVPGSPESGPDLVAYGESTYRESTLEPRPSPGTSFAAPAVTGLALIAAAAALQLRHCWPGARDPSEGIRLVGIGFVDKEFEELRREVVPAAALPVVGPDPDAVASVASIVAENGLAVGVRGTPEVVRRLVVGAARPMPGHGPHEVGAGFVSGPLLLSHLTSLTGADVVALFSADPLPASVAAELARRRVFDPEALELLAAVAHKTAPHWAYDFRTGWLGRVP